MQSMRQGIDVVPGFVISTQTTLDMLVVLKGTYKNPSITKKSCNWLSLSLGNEHHLGFFHYLGGNHWECSFSITAVDHGRFI